MPCPIAESVNMDFVQANTDARSGGFRSGFRRNYSCFWFTHAGEITETIPERIQDSRLSLRFIIGSDLACQPQVGTLIAGSTRGGGRPGASLPPAG